MATENISVTGQWSPAHSSTADNTNVVLTPKGSDVAWSIDTTTPSNTLQGHELSELLPGTSNRYRDRGFILNNGEILYIRGPRNVIVARTVSS